MTFRIAFASRCSVLLLGLISIFHGSTAWAREFDPASLVGLRRVVVSVEYVDKVAKTAGLTQDRLETAVSLRLIKSDIPSTSKQENKQPISSYLYVKVSALQIESSMRFVYSVDVSLNRVVELDGGTSDSKRSTPKSVWATTGSCGTVGYAGVNVFTSAVVGVVEDCIDQFALAYLRGKAMAREAERPTVMDGEN